MFLKQVLVCCLLVAVGLVPHTSAWLGNVDDTNHNVHVRHINQKQKVETTATEVMETDDVTTASDQGDNADVNPTSDVIVHVGPRVFTHHVSSHMTVTQFKLQLMRTGQVPVSQPGDFDLIRTRDRVKLKEKNSPSNTFLVFDSFLSDYFTNGILLLQVEWPFIVIKVVNHQNEHFLKKINKQQNVGQWYKGLKESMSLTSELDIFVKKENNTYANLNTFQTRSRGLYPSYEPISKYLSDEDTVYLVPDGYFKYQFPVYYQGVQVGQVGVNTQETVLSTKLRIQKQFGVPVGNVTVWSSFQKQHRNPTIAQRNYPQVGQTNYPQEAPEQSYPRNPAPVQNPNQAAFQINVNVQPAPQRNSPNQAPVGHAYLDNKVMDYGPLARRASCVVFCSPPTGSGVFIEIQ